MSLTNEMRITRASFELNFVEFKRNQRKKCTYSTWPGGVKNVLCLPDNTDPRKGHDNTCTFYADCVGVFFFSPFSFPARPEIVDPSHVVHCRIQNDSNRKSQDRTEFHLPMYYMYYMYYKPLAFVRRIFISHTPARLSVFALSSGF